MNIKNKFKSIESKTLLFILGFNIGIILILWIVEVLFFGLLYKNYQISSLNNIVEKFKDTKEDVNVLAEELSYQNDVCISVVNSYNIKFDYNIKNVGCVLGMREESLDKINSFISSGNVSEYYNYYDHQGKIRGILYAYKLKDNNIFIYSNLINGNKFLEIFRDQFGYFIIIFMMCSFLISIFIARKITSPIKEITEKSKQLGDGKYDISFPKTGTLEIDELSNTLEEVQNELKKNDEIKRDLLANVSHDLKTPLTMIKAYTELIKDFSHNDKEKMNEHLDIINDEVDRLTILVNDILELSKTQNNANMYNYTKYDLVKEINKIIKKYEVMEYMEEYHFIKDLPKKAMINADKNKLNQVIYNLINNAINYTGSDKTVTIKVSEQDNSYIVEIIDSGKGIDEKDIPYIWDKYYKNDKLHQRNVIGTGLGLSIVKEILTKHNFKYGVKSEKNKGSNFYFKISK